MRVLVVLAAAAIVALGWPRDDRKPRCVVRAGIAPVAVTAAPAAVERAPAGGRAPGLPGRGETQPPGGNAEGSCTLRLRLLDDATGVPLETAVDLWRLDLPEDASRTAGDQLRATQEVAADGSTFRNLPPGRYRVVVHGQSYRAADPPAFPVFGDVTDWTLPVRTPRRHRVHLRVLGEAGAELREGGFRYVSSGYSDRPATPSWARRRRLKVPGCSGNVAFGIGGGVACGGGRSPARWTPAGFDLGWFTEDSRRRHRRWSRTFVARERSVVGVCIDGELAGDRTYLGVAVSVDALRDLVFLPDGRRASEAGALFTARSGAIALTPTTSREAWREIAVEVEVGLVGYENLEFTYRVARPPAPQVMRPRGQLR
ncbi:MAG: hypothetical protein ACYTEZ_04470 [Planctomycetota bacterium]|jgi:hypothetical protein